MCGVCVLLCLSYCLHCGSPRGEADPKYWEYIREQFMQCEKRKNKTKEPLEISQVVGASQWYSPISSSWQKLSIEYLIRQWWYAYYPKNVGKMQIPFEEQAYNTFKTHILEFQRSLSALSRILLLNSTSALPVESMYSYKKWEVK